MSTKTMSHCLTEMREDLESFDASKPERIGSPSLGDVVRQGDLYLVAIEALPKGTATRERQLVPGTTQGSRHVVEGNVTCRCDRALGIYTYVYRSALSEY